MTGHEIICLEIFMERFERANQLDQPDRQEASKRILNDFEAVFEIKHLDKRQQSGMYKHFFDFYEKLKVEAICA